MVAVFERHLFHRLYERRRAALAAEKRWTPPASLQGLDSLWRVAALIDSVIQEEEEETLWDVPRPPQWTLDNRRANASDAARLAQAILEAGGKEGLLLTVYDAAFRTKQVVCAVQDGGVWHHVSLQGMFGVYGSLDEIAEDLFSDWGLYVARDPALRIVAWRVRGADRTREAASRRSGELG